MANRNFLPGAKTLEHETRKVYARCALGLAGAVSSIEGTGVSTITKEATGKYSVTLEDSYPKFLHGAAIIASTAEDTVSTSVTGTSEVATFTFVQKSSCVDGDFGLVTDTSGNKWAFAIDTTGSAPEPTSALWTAVPAARKVNVNVSAATTSTDVSLAVRNAFAALTDIGTVITVGANSTDHFAVTHVLRANVANAAVYKLDGTASPASVSVATGTPGIQTAVDVTANTVAFVAHGLTTGRKLALSIGGGSLPAGLSATTYYAIVVDANTIKFATSVANAEAGTAVDITDYGTAAQTMTITPDAILGSQVAKCEFSNTMQAQVLAGGKIYFNCYDYAGALVQPLNGSLLFIELTLRNSEIKAKGEA